MRGSWKQLSVISPGRCVHRKDQKRLQPSANSLLYPKLSPVGDFRLEITFELRLRDQMYALQQTTAWKDRYKIRSGIEATNSELKRAHGIGRLKVRRLAKVCFAVACKVTACNIKRWAKALSALGRLIYGCTGTVFLVLELSWANVERVPCSRRITRPWSELSERIA